MKKNLIVLSLASLCTLFALNAFAEQKPMDVCQKFAAGAMHQDSATAYSQKYSATQIMNAFNPTMVSDNDDDVVTMYPVLHSQLISYSKKFHGVKNITLACYPYKGQLPMTPSRVGTFARVAITLPNKPQFNLYFDVSEWK